MSRRGNRDWISSRLARVRFLGFPWIGKRGLVTFFCHLFFLSSPWRTLGAIRVRGSLGSFSPLSRSLPFSTLLSPSFIFFPLSIPDSFLPRQITISCVSPRNVVGNVVVYSASSDAGHNGWLVTCHMTCIFLYYPCFNTWRSKLSSVPPLKE